jgi:membrane-associated phospholipid phosphatase
MDMAVVQPLRAAEGAMKPAARTSSPRLAAVLTFAAYFAPFVAAGLVYEMLRGVFRPGGTVHVGDLFAYDARLFSVMTAGGPRALSELIASNTSPWLDVSCGVTYYLFLLEVFGTAAYLFFRARPKMLELSVGFFTVNIVGWVIWLLYPAAPPWYVDQYGVGPVVLDAASSPAGLARLDALLRVPVAATFYAKSANIFGAMPSLHVAYATLVAFVVMPLGGWLRGLALGFAVSMAFSAVYLRHHYIIDVVAGIALALPVAVLVQAALRAVHRARGARA